MLTNPVRVPIKVPLLADSSRYGYEQCIRVGDLVFVAGQVGVDAQYTVVSDDFIPQARQTFQNVAVALDAAGCTLADLVSMTIFLTRLDRDFQDFVAVRKEFLQTDALPTSAAIGVSQLAYPSLLIEIQAIAARRPG